MRRLAAILLLCIFSFQLVGFLFIFKVQQYQVRQEIKQLIKEGIPQNELAIVTVTSQNEHELDWEDQKEFRYRGIMYDVVKKEAISDTATTYYCIHDDEETAIFSDLDEEVKKRMNTKGNGNNPLKNLSKLLSDIYPQPQKRNFILFPSNTAMTYEYFYHYFSPVFDIVSPPPKAG